VNKPRDLFAGTVRVLSSYTLAAVIFMLLFLLTLFGTLEQRHASLSDVRARYFDSPFFLTEYGIPLPGAYLLLCILFVNLAVGGMVRMRRTWSRVGIFAIHIGIALLLLSALVERFTLERGMLHIWEGASGDEFLSTEDWDVTILEQLPEGRERVYTIPYESLPAPGETAVFRAAGLPFDVELSGFLRNCVPRAAPHGSDSTEGFVFVPRAPATREGEQNRPGITATLRTANLRREALLWGVQLAPFVTTIDGRSWAVDLGPRAYPLPFTVALRRFSHEMHPGTNVHAAFSSDVTRIEDNVAQDVHIKMNEPMRYRGYTFYQTNWGPQDDPNATKFYSVFEVVANPADRGPLIALIVIAVGLLVQMIRKLVLYIGAEGRRRA